MHITVIGVSHKTAPIEVRERFYLKPLERELLLSTLRNSPAVYEALVLSTCNRTEIYACSSDGSGRELCDALYRVKGMPRAVRTETHFFTLCGQAAVRHLFEVACGLDSLVLGEKQVLGQLKESVDLSRRMGMLAKPFNILTQIAVRTGKKARSETQIDAGGSSVSWAAAVKAERELGTLEGRSILIIGAGKMGKIAIRHLQTRGAAQIYVTNRRLETAAALAAECGGAAVSFGEIGSILPRIDACICSACAPHYLIEKEIVEKTMKGRPDRQLVCVDISVPRNISPDTGSVPNVSLITIDGLDEVLTGTTETRRRSIDAVNAIIGEKIEVFYDTLNKSAEGRSSGRAAQELPV
ncbi:MAG TPA: glutamyl-tRNA reductase [bacterium]|nr:glutamyl-tRNA reductase [bacterium]